MTAMQDYLLRKAGLEAVAEAKRLQEALDTCRELRRFDQTEMEKLRREIVWLSTALKHATERVDK